MSAGSMSALVDSPYTVSIIFLSILAGKFVP